MKNPKNLVTNLDLSKRLKELNVPQESLFYWFKSFVNDEITLVYLDKTMYLCKETKDRMKYSAFTSAELGELLPTHFERKGDYMDIRYGRTKDGKWRISFNTYGENFELEEEMAFFTDKNEANVRAKMLISLIENNFLKF